MRMKSFVLLTLPLLSLGGCYAGSEDDHCTGCGEDVDYAYWVPGAMTSTIDTAASMDEIYPGEDVGVYVEYQGNGSWYVYTTCDTLTSGQSCRWQIDVVTSTGSFYSFDPGSLTGDDYYGTSGEYAWFDVITTTEVDGMTLTTEPDASVQIAVYGPEFDGSEGNRWLYWVGDGGVHPGAATNPIELIPQG